MTGQRMLAVQLTEKTIIVRQLGCYLVHLAGLIGRPDDEKVSFSVENMAILQHDLAA